MHYIYQGKHYCERCGDGICEELEEDGLAPRDGTPDDEYTSDDYPKGPYKQDEGDGRRIHCVHCGTLVD